jgi:hypothetical protein
MARSWKIDMERMLMDANGPSVLTTAMLRGMVNSGRDEAPSTASFSRWLALMRETGKLREVIKGVYLNVLGHRDVSPAAAAHWIRHRSVVSLSWVLEQAGLTNNMGDTHTCVIPTDPTWPNPQIGDRVTAVGTFRFFAMPAHLIDERAGAIKDTRDLRFDYARATLEKAFLDWIHLGSSSHSRLKLPPMDVAFDELNHKRLLRLAKNMGLTEKLSSWEARYRTYQTDPDVEANASTRLRL